LKSFIAQDVINDYVGGEIEFNGKLQYLGRKEFAACPDESDQPASVPAE